MKSFKQVAEELTPKFERATKTDTVYTGQINGKTWVVPHTFHADDKKTPMRHAIVVSPTHVLHNNPTLTPEESARVHSHIKDIHGGQDSTRLGNLDEERQLALHLGMTKSDRPQPSKEVPAIKKAETHYKHTHKLVPGTPEHQAERDKYRHAALYASRQAATLAFARKRGIIKERTINTGSLKFNKIANSKPITYNSFGKIMKENTLEEGRPIRGDVFSHHQTLIAKKTFRMPDAMLGVMGGPSKEDSRKHLKKIGWTQKQIHDHEHAQFAEEVNMVQEHVWKVTDHLGHTHEVEAKDHSEAKKKTVSVGGVHPQGIPMTHWHKVRIEKKNLEEKVLTPAETDKKEEMVKSMKKGIQGFKERYGKDAKSVMYATATKQAKHLAEGIEPLDESFMSTYTRNENANRHTANIVHLAKHFGDAADQSQAKFYAQELKKHGHNIHHEAQYKLHEKLFPKALAAHHMKEATEGLKPLTQYTYVPNRGHFVGGKKGDRAFLKHQAEYTKRKKITPVKEDVEQLDESEKILKGFVPQWKAADKEHALKLAALKKKQKSISIFVKEKSEQLDELKMPKFGFVDRHVLGATHRGIVKNVHGMAHSELSFLHKNHGDRPDPKGSPAEFQHHAIKRELNKRGDAEGTHKPMDKSKFVKKNLEESQQTHSDTFNTIKRVLRENYMMQDRRFQGGYEIPHSTHTEYHAWGQVTHHSDAEAKADRDAKAKEWKQQGHKVTKHRSTNAIYDPDGPFTTSGTVYSARKHHAQ